MTSPVIVTVPDELVAQLRRATATSVGEYSDIQLAEILALTMDEDGSFSVNRAAAKVWEEKAAALAPLVDVSESGSSRKLSDAHKNALGMAKYYGDLAGETTVAVAAANRPRTRAIVRP